MRFLKGVLIPDGQVSSNKETEPNCGSMLLYPTPHESRFESVLILYIKRRHILKDMKGYKSIEHDSALYLSANTQTVFVY